MGGQAYFFAKLSKELAQAGVKSSLILQVRILSFFGEFKEACAYFVEMLCLNGRKKSALQLLILHR